MKDEEHKYSLANKPSVWNAAQDHLVATGKVPTVAQLRPHFATPQSPSIAVYFQEWKLANADMIRLHRGGKEAWKAHALRLESELKTALRTCAGFQADYESLCDWLAVAYPDAVKEWASMNAIEDASLCKAQ